MTKIKYTFLFFIFITVHKAQVMWQFDKDSIITWHYQEGDEFNGDKLNTNYWSDWYGWARSISSNKEQQYYTQFKNHFLKDGKLILTAKREDIDARYVDWMSDNDTIKNNGKFDGLNKRKFTYSAGMIQSQKEFLYGYFEIKFRVQKEIGFWPAFWLYGGTPNEEIDWMELKSEKTNKIHVAVHCQKSSDEFIKTFFGKKRWGSWVKFDGSLNEGFNIISGIWTSNGLKYYLNGECIAISNVKMNIPKKLVANIAVAHNKGPFHPGPKENFKDSANFEIDYIRVWNRDSNKSKQAETKVFSASSISENKRTSLISKAKTHYGKKSQHKNEGFFASLLPQLNGKYQMSVLGKNIPKDASLIIKDDSGNIKTQVELKYGITVLDLTPGQSVIVKAFNKEALYTVN